MSNEDYLAHYGILGQKWGRRRYQNPDGTLTPLGRERLYGDSGKKKVVSGWLNNGGRYISRLDKNKLKRMMSAADAERRIDVYNDRIRSRKRKGKDTLKLEEKRRKVVANKDLYSRGLTKGEIEIGRAELRKRDEKIGRIASIPIAAAVGIGLGAVNRYLPSLLSGAVSHTWSYAHISPEMSMIQSQVKRNPIMDALIAPTGRDYLTEDIIKENILNERYLTEPVLKEHRIP